MVAAVFSIPSTSNFLAGPENRLARVAVDHLMERAPIGPNFGPLCVYGPPGRGKSHLVQCLVAAWRDQHPDDQATVVESAELGQRLARGKKKELALLRSASLLVVEDVEQLTGSVSAHRHFQMLLDYRTATRLPTLITASSAPGTLAELPPSLRNRLAGGLVVPLARPEFGTRAAIVRSLAQDHHLTMTHRAVELIARRLDRSITDLVDAVEGLARQPVASNMAARVDHSRAQRYLTSKGRAEGPTLRRIVSKTARAYGLTDRDLKGRSRRRSVTTARSVAMYLAWKRGGFSLQKIGKYLGNRDHTTVLHGCRKIDLLLPQDAAVQEAVSKLEHLWLPATTRSRNPSTARRRAGVLCAKDVDPCRSK